MLDASKTSKIEIRQGPRINPKRRQVQGKHAQKRRTPKKTFKRRRTQRLATDWGTRTGRVAQARHGQILTGISQVSVADFRALVLKHVDTLMREQGWPV